MFVQSSLPFCSAISAAADAGVFVLTACAVNRTQQGNHTIRRVHFDTMEEELLNLLRRGLDATVWTEGENPREVGWVWINGNKGVQCIETWD